MRSKKLRVCLIDNLLVDRRIFKLDSFLVEDGLFKYSIFWLENELLARHRGEHLLFHNLY